LRWYDSGSNKNKGAFPATLTGTRPDKTIKDNKYTLQEIVEKKMAVKVDLEKCTGCGTCKEVCPVEAIEINDDKAKVDEEECVDCGTCVEECPEGALSLEE
jgi:Fe-S-cluster-containing hydrogenase component 2